MLAHGTRRISSATHFYQNRQLEAYASKPATRLTLRQLVRACVWQEGAVWNGATGVLWEVYE